MRGLLAYSETATIEEKISLRVRADSDGNLYIPIAGYSVDGTQDCEYDWNISIDGGTATNFSGVGSASKITAGYGYRANSVHTIVIKPASEEYAWARAFGYHNSGAEIYLINIISDLSYKGFALSNIYTGNYYKYKQYYGCTNLINTDEESLPDTVQVVGDYYRAYEYYGCTSLTRGADEKVYKSVRVLGNYYRANQYQGCTGLTRMDLRAINRATIGTNYRENQLSGCGNATNPFDLYIEGGIVEGGSLGLTNDNVKNIYVFSQLVSDYQTKLSSITSTKIVADSNQSNRNHEYIEVKIKANASGKINIPVAGYSNTGTQDCAYNWKITIGTYNTTISGTGSATSVEVGSGLTSGTAYRVVIEPTTIAYGWARAFGFYGSGAEAYITEIVHDSYKGYATDYTDTGDYYKYRTYYGCTALTNSYEKLPTSCEEIGDYYMAECYKNCTGLTTAFYEVLTTMTIGESYRESMYYGCSALATHYGIAGLISGTTTPTDYKKDMLTGAGNELVAYMTRYEGTGIDNSLGLVDGGVKNINASVEDRIKYINNSLWSNISDSKFGIYYYDYAVYDAVDISRYTTLIGTYSSYPGRPSSGNFSYTLGQYSSYYRGIAEYKGNLYEGDGLYGTIYIPCYSKNSVTGNKYGIYVPFSFSESGITRHDGYDISGISGGREDGNEKGLAIYENGNNFVIGFSKSSGGTVYKHLYYTASGSAYDNTYNEQYTDWEGSVSVSKDGYNVFFNKGDYLIKYSVGTRYGNISSEITHYSIGTTGLEFSDDGLTAYISDDYGSITQYSLTSPWELNNKTSTGKTLNISGSWTITRNKKYLFVYDGTTKIYQYT